MSPASAEAKRQRDAIKIGRAHQHHSPSNHKSWGRASPTSTINKTALRSSSVAQNERFVLSAAQTRRGYGSPRPPAVPEQAMPDPTRQKGKQRHRAHVIQRKSMDGEQNAGTSAFPAAGRISVRYRQQQRPVTEAPRWRLTHTDCAATRWRQATATMSIFHRVPRTTSR